MNYMDACRNILRDHQAILRQKKLNGELTGMGQILLQSGSQSGDMGIPAELLTIYQMSQLNLGDDMNMPSKTL